MFKCNSSAFDINVSILRSIIFNLSILRVSMNVSRLLWVDKSVLFQWGVLTKPIFNLLKFIFWSSTIYSSNKIDRKRDKSSTDLVIRPNVSIEGELGRMPDLSKSPYVGL